MAKKIVLADDEEDVLTITKTRLIQQGYEVIIARDGEEALALIRQHRPHLAVLDIRMPKLEGTEICQRMKHDRQLKSIPVLLISASSGALMPSEVAASGADDALRKPFETVEFFQKVRRLIGEAA